MEFISAEKIEGRTRNLNRII